MPTGDQGLYEWGMAKSLGKTILKWTVLITPWVLAAVLAAGWWLTVWTPGYLERLVPRLAADMGLTLTEFHVRNTRGCFRRTSGRCGWAKARTG